MKDNSQPAGTFVDELDERYNEIIESMLVKTPQKRKEKPKPYSSKDLTEQYEFFRSEVHNPKRVFYPCCNLDISPVKGFPDSEVILMDNEKGLDKIMKREGVGQFIHGNVLTYSPEKKFDLAIILNPHLSSRDLTKYLQIEGYVMANNWHNNASELLVAENFEGIGTIDRNESGLYLARGDFSKLEPHQFPTYFYVFKKLGEEK